METAFLTQGQIVLVPVPVVSVADHGSIHVSTFKWLFHVSRDVADQDQRKLL
jgi:hypothetical protein